MHPTQSKQTFADSFVSPPWICQTTGQNGFVCAPTICMKHTDGTQGTISTTGYKLKLRSRRVNLARKSTAREPEFEGVLASERHCSVLPILSLPRNHRVRRAPSR